MIVAFSPLKAIDGILEQEQEAPSVSSNAKTICNEMGCRPLDVLDVV
jgi:hypothetical protein